MSWLERAVPRALVLLACMAGYLLFLYPGPVGARDWALAVGALALSVSGRWTPLGASLAQSALLVVTDVFGFAVVVPMKVLACVLLFELTVRRGRGQVAVAAGVLAAVVCAIAAGDAATALFKAAVVVGAPLLLGAYVRLARQGERDRAEILVVRARLAERTAIARELHDLVAHHVSSMVLRINVARHVMRRPDPVLDDLHATGSAALADLRKLVEVLRDPGREEVSVVDPARLPAALERVVEQGIGNGLDVRPEVDPAVATLDAARGFAVLRLAQEALANAAKHAPAATVWLEVALTGDGAVRVSVTDDGPPVPAVGSGHGLAGMRERVALLGGQFSAGPAERGWRLSAVLP